LIELHLHTKYSLVDSITEPVDLIKKIKEQNKPAVCVTEHGNLYSSIEMYKLCKENGIKYMHGCEVYICQDVNVNDKNNKYNHLVLISKNETGRLNLIKLVSESSNYKYFGKPRIDFKMLKQHKEGIVVLSACMAGEVQRSLMKNDVEKAKSIAKKYKDEFNEDYYLEFQSHRDELQQELNRKIVDIAKELDIKYVVTTDAHYINEEDQKYHSVFVEIGQSREVGEIYNDCYVQTDEDVMRICQSTTTEENAIAIENTYEIMEKCNVEIPLSSPIMPHVIVPSEYSSEIDYLKNVCLQGWKKRRIHLKTKDEQLEYKNRLRYEVEIIERMGFEGYFLLVNSYANSVKRKGIARGSGGGSLTAYLMQIVDTDPIKYGLYFERFIDVGALELLDQGKITKSQLKIPDFDLDFGKEDRDKIMKYITNEYGKENVASLGSFQYIWAKGAIKDIGKVLGISFEETNQMTKKLDDETIQQVLELGLLEDYVEKYPELFDYANRLAGLPKSFSVHPCGKIITTRFVEYYNATEISDNGEYVLQGDMHTADDLGLVKIDVLGLRTIDVIYDVLEMINKDYEYIAPHNLNFEDKTVLDNFRNGNTSGVFQFESSGMKSTLSNIQCSSLYDLSVANALYRPGSMDYIENYAKRRKGEEKYEFLHKDLEEILKDSYGIIVFQEQLIEVGRIAGLSNPDELRQATAKKKDKLMNKIKPELFEGLIKRGWTEEKVEELWVIMLKFAKYSFNKSHSVAYAIIAYICMYLKTYHPHEFIVAWMNSFSGKVVKLLPCATEANRLKINLNIPNWRNASSINYVNNGEVYIGTESIKHVNAGISKNFQEIKDNKYETFVDLLVDITENARCNSRQVKILTKLNFFSEFGGNKKLLNIYDVFDDRYKKTHVEKTKVKRIEEVKEFQSTCKEEELLLNEQVECELEYLGYIKTIIPNIPMDYAIITEVDRKYKNPMIYLYRVRTGETEKVKVKLKDFDEKVINKFDMIKTIEVSMEGRWKKTEKGGWKQDHNDKEPILKKWSYVKFNK